MGAMELEEKTVQIRDDFDPDKILASGQCFRPWKQADSRLYNYVHYPSDVLCGMLLGVICAVVVVLVFKKTGLDNRLSPQKVKEG